MIQSVRGRLSQKTPTFVVVDVAGIGLGIKVSLGTYEKLGEVGSEVSLITYLQVKEDALQLYGFLSSQERELFLLLISISGIGPKLGIGILSGVDPQSFCDMVKNGDTAKIRLIPGIGAKTADRIIVELKNKIDKISLGGDSGKPSASNHFDEALFALKSLGYNSNIAQKAIDKVSKDTNKDISVEEIIKLALKTLM